MLVDVSIIASHDAGTGIQRVVRSLLLELLASPPAGFEVRPIRATRKQPYRYADRYLASLTAEPSPVAEERVIVSSDDVFLGLDLASRIAPRRHMEFLAWRKRGVRCAFVVYDLLPVLHPQWFTPRAQQSFRHWLSALAVHADALFCISASVAQEVSDFIQRRFDLDQGKPGVQWFHLGANLPVSENAVKETQTKQQSVLMVGTIEPRKGHAHILDAFEALWREGAQAHLVIAGRPGWHMDAFFDRLTNHTEFGERLHWYPEIDDAGLAQLYANSSGLVMASEAEGFGLPLVEAARYGKPLFLRDLPVFREVAGAHATYFVARHGMDIAPQLSNWLSQLDNGTAPTSYAIECLSWEASSEQLKGLIAKLGTAR
ncbi:glycosyltransferase family 4 protein [Paraburkholderia atlantica]|uniref:glycosyltransferase family 4 protein n=1 Tax=Paraburkholderia atlantica TaxID=2654982 RepID=UPI0035D44658